MRLRPIDSARHFPCHDRAQIWFSPGRERERESAADRSRRVAGAARGRARRARRGVAERDEALSQVDRLQHLLRQLQRMQFGRRSEKLDPDQFALAFEDIEQAVAASEAADDKQNEERARARAEKRRPSAAPFPPICRACM